MDKGIDVWTSTKGDKEWVKGRVVKFEWIKKGVEAKAVIERRDRRRLSLKVNVSLLDEHPTLKIANNFDMVSVDDLIRLPHLHEPGFCHALSQRYEADKIYTFTGEILLAVNPYKRLPLYSPEIIQAYIKAGELQNKDMAPHVYAVTDAAYRLLHTDRSRVFSRYRDQSILVSGDSGSGKTETTKIVMQYLASVAGGKKDDSVLMQQVLCSSPIIEAFGNARTICNDNSSRFGKFIKIQFDSTQALVGASIQTYLLEKVRLVQQRQQERNFHVFYELLAGASIQERLKWQLNDAEMYHYLNQSGCLTRRDGVDDRKQFELLGKSLDTMQFTTEEQDNIFETLASLLHLGNIHFESENEQDGSRIASDSKQAADFVVKVIDTSFDDLQKLLCRRRMEARNEVYSIQLQVVDAEQVRDALAKYVYGKLFDWIISRINKAIENTNKQDAVIGVLDIFGFENLETNGFEQFCINFANETLQQHFNRTVLRQEQEEYELEGISWSFIDFPDNFQCIDLIQGRPEGILELLDEESIMPQGGDTNFIHKVYKRHGNHPYFEASRADQVAQAFVIRHYAGDIRYQTKGMCLKNKNDLYPELPILLKESPNPFLRQLVSISSRSPTTTTSRISAPSMKRLVSSRCSLSLQFRSQLNTLMDTVSQTNCFYIRCIKSNDQCLPNRFDARRVCDQLRSGGVLEAVRVNRAGYPVRILHSEFLKRYRSLLPNGLDEDGEVEEQVKELVKVAGREYTRQYPQENGSVIQVGTSKVFFRTKAIQFIESLVMKRQSEIIIKLQALVRGFIQRCQWLAIQHSTLTIQRDYRCHLARLELFRLRCHREEQDRKARLEEEEKARLEEEKPEQDDDEWTSEGATTDEEEDEDDGCSTFRLTSEFHQESQVKLNPVRRISGRRNSRPLTKEPGDSVLHVAVTCCSETDIMTLIQNGLNINITNKIGRTPLHTAAKNSNARVVELLLRFNADPNCRDNDGKIPLHLTRDPLIASMLLKRQSNPDAADIGGRTSLIDASERGDTRMVQVLLKHRASINASETRHGQSALHIAVRKGQHDVIRELCQRSTVASIINEVDRNQHSPLHFAVGQDRPGTEKLVKFLIHNGADVNLANIRGQTPLAIHIMTTERQDSKVAQVLLENGARADVRVKNNDTTLLHMAMERGLIEIAKVLVAKGADLHAVNMEGKSVLDGLDKSNLLLLLKEIQSPPRMLDIRSSSSCMACFNTFKHRTRRRNCFHCGRVCCKPCVSFKVKTEQFPRPFHQIVERKVLGRKRSCQKVCKACFVVFNSKQQTAVKKSGFLARVLGYQWDVMATTA